MTVAAELEQATAVAGPPEDTDDSAINALLDAVKQWRFSPGLDPDGNPVAMYVTLKVHLVTE